jgi:hypothetical protein
MPCNVILYRRFGGTCRQSACCSAYPLMEAMCSTETSVNCQTTRHCILAISVVRTSNSTNASPFHAYHIIVIYLCACLSIFIDREAQRRENGANGGNASVEPEPSVSQTQQQVVNRDAMRRVQPQPDVVSNTNTRSAQSEVPIPPPRRCPPAGGVRVRPCPPPRRSRRSRSTSSNEKTSAVPTDNRTRENWQEVGKELRKIADDFCASSLEVGEWYRL